jgi:hypothetical protein
MHGTHNVKR